MLKKTWILFLGLVVYMGSACVTPTHASSASTVVIVHIQAASPAGAKDEMVTIYNNSNEAVNITHWCLANKAAVKFACFNPPDSSLAYYLPAFGYAVIASESFFNSSATLPENVPFIYAVTNQSSGSLVNSNDVVSLVDANNVSIDSYAWSSAMPSGKIASRSKSLVTLNLYEVLNGSLDWFYEPLPALPISTIQVIDVPPIDAPPPEPETPVDEASPPASPSVQIPEKAIITELLPNPEGADTGNEYIEIYNPNPDTAFGLASYKLRVGPQLEKTYSFPAGVSLSPLEYRLFTNADIKFTLLNSSSAVQLEYDGVLVGSVIAYADPPEGFGYALFEGNWYFTATPTPDAQNTINFSEDADTESEDESTDSASSLKPCAANQYRSPETNRCRNIATASSSPVPCASTQYRSPETNRCRTIGSDTSELAPCKVGQERNPDTNRCRNSVAMSTADHGVKDGVIQSSSTGVSWYWWLGIGGVVVLILGYAVWEWREELLKVWKTGTHKFARKHK